MTGRSVRQNPANRRSNVSEGSAHRGRKIILKHLWLDGSASACLNGRLGIYSRTKKFRSDMKRQSVGHSTNTASPAGPRCSLPANSTGTAVDAVFVEWPTD